MKRNFFKSICLRLTHCSCLNRIPNFYQTLVWPAQWGSWDRHQHHSTHSHPATFLSFSQFWWIMQSELKNISPSWWLHNIVHIWALKSFMGRKLLYLESFCLHIWHFCTDIPLVYSPLLLWDCMFRTSRQPWLLCWSSRWGWGSLCQTWTGPLEPKQPPLVPLLWTLWLGQLHHQHQSSFLILVFV